MLLRWRPRFFCLLRARHLVKKTQPCGVAEVRAFSGIGPQRPLVAIDVTRIRDKENFFL